MGMIKKTLYKVTSTLPIMLLFAIFSACSAEDMPDINPSDDAELRITAEVAQQLHSRAYQVEGYVVGGTYYLSYPLNTTNNPYNVASVEFGKEGMNPAIGTVTVPPDKSLKWKDVGGGSTPTFYLDNVVGPFDDPALTKIKFSSENNPYKAGLYDEENGTNDLLWGEVTAQRDVKTVNFDLHHNMSRVKVQVTLNKNDEYGSDLTLDGATVEISSINQTPLSFNRLDGTLELPTIAAETDEEYNRVYTPLTLVKYPRSDEEEGAEGIIKWASEGTDENDTNIIEIYTSQDFVLPPQGLLENEHRPRLTITLKNGTKYSGILPHAMEIEGGTPAYLYFLPEHILTIRTVITEEPPLLSFMPVWVMKWVDKGEFDLEAHQAGIYRAEEFYKLIEYYEKNNEYQLVRYGYLYTDEGSDEQRWNFDFFSGVTLEWSEIAGSMNKGDDTNKKDFSFYFNNYAVYIRSRNANGIIETKRVNEKELYDIVTGSN